MLPVGRLIGKHSWDVIIPPILDNDLQDVAFAAGAIDRKTPVEMPPASGALLRLMHTLEIDGKPATEALNIPPLLPKHSD